MGNENMDMLCDKIRGSLFGGAVGDALGYPIEFFMESEIFSKYGPQGIQEYTLDEESGKALISDDTQMSLFTADGILVAETKLSMGGIGGGPRCYVANSYMDWLLTQEQSFDKVQRMPQKSREKHISWLLDVPELYSRRAPGNTCISALKGGTPGCMNDPKNNSKGCGGIMRVAPLGLWHNFHGELKELDREGENHKRI